ncbi:MAG: ferrous iron transport protein A [Lachnospiraceae bacterium]|nr:ferrous iron transport protein A [Lachnospiraceae bacterium]
MKLSELAANKHGTVKSLGRDEHFLNRISSVGITEGAVFQVVKNDRKMPMLIYVRETLLALNRKDCEKIEVSEVRV